MKQIFSTTNETTKEFYFYLGLLSTKFAKIETYTMSLLGKLVVDEVFLINTITQKNTLSQNTELLKKINLYRKFEVENIKKLIEKVSALRSERNLFIHAIWGEPHLKGAKVLISCLEPKIVSKVNSYGRMWAEGREHEFELSYLVEKIREADLIIAMQNELLNILKSQRF